MNLTSACERHRTHAISVKESVSHLLCNVASRPRRTKALSTFASVLAPGAAFRTIATNGPLLILSLASYVRAGAGVGWWIETSSALRHYHPDAPVDHPGHTHT